MSRTPMARWMIELGDIFDPLVALIKEKIHASGVCHVDETTVQVLKEKGRKPENLSYMWVISFGKYDTPAVLFEYHARRSAKTAAKFLNGFKGNSPVRNGTRKLDVLRYNRRSTRQRTWGTVSQGVSAGCFINRRVSGLDGCSPEPLLPWNWKSAEN